MKLKVPAIILIILGLIKIVDSSYELLWLINHNSGYHHQFIANILTILFYIAIIMVAISLLKIGRVQIEENNIVILKNEDVKNITVGNWLVIFLISSIPLLGIIYVIVWSNDVTNKVRMKWAIASLIWWGIVFIISLSLWLIIYFL